MERGCNVTNSEGWEYWVPLLGKPLHVALQELLHDGLLRMGTPREKITETHTMAELKSIATTYNIKLPRKKDDAVAKLFDALPTEMQHRSDQFGYVYCTQPGKDVLMAYYHEECALHLQAQTEVLGHLEDGNLTDAISATRRYWDTQVFNRGSFGGDDNFVMTFLGNVLGGNYSHNDKMAACLLYLLSDDYPGKWAIEKTSPDEM